MSTCKIISFKVTKRDGALITQIAKRAHRMSRSHGVSHTLRDWQMDITACHANGNHLPLASLLTADDANFGHDLYGIRRFLNRETGQLGGCFSPRFSAPAAVTA